MRFQCKTEQELQNEGLIENGIYQFEVSQAVEKLSRSGKEMIELKIVLWDKDGRERNIFDYLTEGMAHKLRHFCDSTGLLGRYESGELRDSDCVGKSGKLELIIQKGKERPEGGYYPDRNSVKDYIKVGDNIVNIPPDGNTFNDDLPF